MAFQHTRMADGAAAALRDADYWSCVRDLRQRICDQFTDGRLHAFEAHLKERRRTAGRPHHEAHPAELGERQPNWTG